MTAKKTKKRAKKVVKAWMPVGTRGPIVFKTGAPVGNGRMEVFRVRKHGERYWPHLTRVTITIED